MALLSIAAIDVDQFDIPFIQPIKVGRAVLHSRKGFILSLTDQEGKTGFGEIAPLPGLDRTSLTSCRDDLVAVKEMGGKLLLQPERFNMTEPLLGMASLPHSFTSHTIFGIESALLNLYLQHKQKEGLTGDLHLPDPLKIPVNGLFIPSAENEETAGQIQALKTSGVKIVKVKIGRLPADEEIRWILSLAKSIGKDLTLRLDGNKTLSAETYSRYFSALGHLSVEYIEEPMCDGKTSSRADIADIPWPLALDESLPLYLENGNPDFARFPFEVRTIILKPGLLSGLHGMARFIAESKIPGIKTILSSAFNTGITLATLGVFSLLAGLPPNTAQGLDTLRYLKLDVLSDSPLIRKGFLTIPQRLLTCGMHLNRNILTKAIL